ncbi:MAG: copper homeostasis protein CutC [Propionicimonas sp.]|nr:copper homeostasis protein CutC [Propionicimonas sp.]
MSGLLEVIALGPADAERAEAGGADRIELVGTMDEGGLSPSPGLVEQVRAATSIQLRVMVRLREGFSTDGGEAVRLQGLIASYADAGADGMVLGYLNGLGEVDREVVGALTDDGTWPWTFHRALDSVLDTDRAWQVLRDLPRLDQVLTAGSARGVEQGLDELLGRARTDPWAATVIMAGGGLRAEDVPWLARAGIRAFHIGSAARPGGSFRAYVDEALVRSWRQLVDSEVRHRRNG